MAENAQHDAALTQKPAAKKEEGEEGAAPAKGDAKAAAGDKKAEAKPEAKAEAKKK